ncbi:MAG: head GIN domain-containing protein [Niabella sp.]
MKQLVWAVSVLTFITMLPGCKKIFPDGPAIRETRTVADFDKIEAAFSGNVEFVQGPAAKVEVEAAHNIQSYILTEVIANKLVLKTRPNVTIKGGSVTIYVSNPSLTGATLSGSGNISVLTGITTSVLSLKLSGSGNIMIPALSATSLKADLTGSGNLSIQGGTTHNQEVHITGHGDYSTHLMRSEEAKVRLTGSGNAKLWAENRLDITITGSGNVWYTGTPTVNTSISGSGKVRKM